MPGRVAQSADIGMTVLGQERSIMACMAAG
jgi:hypothetical protein